MSELPAGGRPFLSSAFIVGAQASAAEKLTHAIPGGTWHRQLGRCTCPICGRSRSLLIEHGNRAPLVTCITTGCSSREIIRIVRARGWLA